MSVRRFIPARMGVGGFFAALNNSVPPIRYVVVRWFEHLPDVRDREDVDIFVHEADAGRVRNLLRGKSLAQRLFGASRVKVDLKNTRGDFLPPYLAERIISRSLRHASGANVPCPEDYFYSLAHRATTHAEGLAARSPRGIAYGDKLRELATSIGLDIPITHSGLMEALARDARSGPSGAADDNAGVNLRPKVGALATEQVIPNGAMPNLKRL